MNFEEHAAKSQVLARAGVPAPNGRLVGTPEEAVAAFAAVGPCVVKAQVPTSKRGKAGGIRPANSARETVEAARSILGMSIGGHMVTRVLVEEKLCIVRELY